MEFERYYREYIPWFGRELRQRVRTSSPESLYAPVRYILEHSGKQLRPAVLSAIAYAFGGISRESSFPAASCVEMIHNFTLVHDDIMDADILRHGKETVHEKWDTNKAILSGDGLFVTALSELNAFRNDPELYSRLLPLTLNAVMRVCEGQAEDMEFEDRTEVSLDEYVNMVTHKTAYLLAVSARLGALIGGASEKEEKITEKLMLDLGVVFQIQDDLLELTSDTANMGKTLGSDLVKQKKTYPYLFAKRELSEDQWREFRGNIREENIIKYGISPARKLLEENFIFDKIYKIIKLYNDNIQEMIQDLPLRTQKMFRTMVSFIMHREN
ncbi:MAG: polyprenyl synthetase family protein [Candidatus Marinimicrobia bacterium]|nr:polyprenyl synthetase family protein [Candidatus Neomarinimicrobiota bacterium]